MNGFTDAKVEKYIYGLLPKRDAVLSEMEKLAGEREIPIIGPAVARLLFLLARASGAKRIFEMGSAIGYSAIWLARAAGQDAEVYYTEGDPANEKRAKEFASRAGVAGRIRFLLGDALELIDRIAGDFDMIFIDVDKVQYPQALAKAVPRVRSGGLLITDNTLWSAKVVTKAEDEDTRAIQEFNTQVYAVPNLFPVLIPLRDGVTVCLKH